MSDFVWCLGLIIGSTVSPFLLIERRALRVLRELGFPGLDVLL
jgi:hypothetical protein